MNLKYCIGPNLGKQKHHRTSEPRRVAYENGRIIERHQNLGTAEPKQNCSLCIVIYTRNLEIAETRTCTCIRRSCHAFVHVHTAAQYLQGSYPPAPTLKKPALGSCATPAPLGPPSRGRLPCSTESQKANTKLKRGGAPSGCCTPAWGRGGVSTVRHAR